MTKSEDIYPSADQELDHGCTDSEKSFSPDTSFEKDTRPTQGDIGSLSLYETYFDSDIVKDLGDTSQDSTKPLNDLGRRNQTVINSVFSDSIQGIVELIASGKRSKESSQSYYTYRYEGEAKTWCDKNQQNIINRDSTRNTFQSKTFISSESVWWLNETICSYNKTPAIKAWLENNKKSSLILEESDETVKLGCKISPENIDWIDDEDDLSIYLTDVRESAIKSKKSLSPLFDRPRVEFSRKCQAYLIIENNCDIILPFNKAIKTLDLGTTTVLEMIEQPAYKGTTRYRISSRGYQEPYDLFVEKNSVHSETSTHLNELATLLSTGEFELSKLFQWQIINQIDDYGEYQNRRIHHVRNAFFAQKQTYESIITTYQENNIGTELSSNDKDYVTGINDHLSLGAPQTFQTHDDTSINNEHIAAITGIKILDYLYENQTHEIHDISVFKKYLIERENPFKELLGKCIKKFIANNRDHNLLELLFIIAFHSDEALEVIGDNEALFELKQFAQLMLQIEPCPTNLADKNKTLLSMHMPSYLRQLYIDTIPEGMLTSLVSVYADCLSQHGTHVSGSPWHHFGEFYTGLSNRIDLIPISVRHIMAQRALFSARLLLWETLESIRSKEGLEWPMTELLTCNTEPSDTTNKEVDAFLIFTNQFKECYEKPKEKIDSPLICEVRAFFKSLVSSVSNQPFGMINNFFESCKNLLQPNPEKSSLLSNNPSEIASMVVETFASPSKNSLNQDRFPSDSGQSIQSGAFCLNQSVPSKRNYPDMSLITNIDYSHHGEIRRHSL